MDAQGRFHCTDQFDLLSDVDKQTEQEAVCWCLFNVVCKTE